jgi:hypothetical protein
MMAAFVATLFAQEQAAQAAWSGTGAVPWNVAPQKTRKTVLRVKAEAEEIAENSISASIRENPR